MGAGSSGPEGLKVVGGGLECESCSARSTLLTASGVAVLRPIPRLVLMQPYFLVGAETEVSLLGFRTQWELDALMSRYRLGQAPEGTPSQGDGDLQTDVFLTLSIPLRD